MNKFYTQFELNKLKVHHFCLAKMKNYALLETVLRILDTILLCGNTKLLHDK